MLQLLFPLYMFLLSLTPNKINQISRIKGRQQILMTNGSNQTHSLFQHLFYYPIIAPIPQTQLIVLRSEKYNLFLLSTHVLIHHSSGNFTQVICIILNVPFITSVASFVYARNFQGCELRSKVMTIHL